MLEYAHMLHVSYYAQNYAGIIHQGLTGTHTYSHMRNTHIHRTHTQHLSIHRVINNINMYNVSLSKKVWR